MEIPEHCPGLESAEAGKASNCQGCPNQQICTSGIAKNNTSTELVKTKLSTIKHKLLILSGKGGVGKSTLTALLARCLASNNEDKNVAVLDVDICGPSMPMVMGVLGEKIHQSGSGWSPVFVEDNLSVMSIGFLLQSSNDAVIWRGPKKNGMIKQFFTEVDWGEDIEYMLIDTPPGTSDEHLSLVQFLNDIPHVSALVVTNPQEISLLDVRKEIDFLRKVKIPILGIVENMTPFICPKCKIQSEIFPANSGGTKNMAVELNVPYLGNIPLNPIITRSCDEGLNPLEKLEGDPLLCNIKCIVSKIQAQLP